MSNTRNVIVQDIFRPFEPAHFRDLKDCCTKIGANYDYLSQEKLPIVYKKRFVINRVKFQ